MARHILIEELRLTAYAPRGLPAREYDAMQQTLDGPLFHDPLHRAVRRLVRRHPA
jgi:hypothetical protein